MSFLQEFGLGFWFTIAFIALIVEFFLPTLIALFIAGGAVSAAITLLLGGGLLIQVGVFFAITLLSSLFLKPLIASRWRDEGSKLSGPDRLIGKTATVVSLDGNIVVKIDGQDWSGKLINKEDVFEPGAEVIIAGVEGAHLLIKRV